MADTDQADWIRVTSTHESVPSYNAYTYPIQKPGTDHREYRIIKLRNGLKVTLVHDEKATKAAATLNVAIGHLSDPDDLPSLTLLCFRMLYKGTKEFPKENDFIDFLNLNHGGFDAETDASNTTYHMNVAAPRLPEALSRLSALFHCPLFPTECLSQELKTMTEHSDQPLDASLRVLTVLMHLSKNGHVLKQPKSEKPLEKLRKLVGKPEASPELCDDPEVLKEIRRRLVEWWEKEYCSSRMDLCVVGKEPLDELAEMVATRFSPIRNRNADSLLVVRDHPIGPDETGQIIMIQTGADIPQLQVTFALENQGPLWRHKPALLISLLTEQKRQGSLHSHLETRHWITALRCAPRSVARGIDTLELTVDLTDEGFVNYRSVILAISEFFSFLRSKSPLDTYHQQDCASLMSNGFMFSEIHLPEPHSQFIAESMQRPYPPELLLAAPRSNWEWGDDYVAPNGDVFGPGEQEKFHSYVEMARLENARVILSARVDDFEKLDQTFGLSQEDWKWNEEPLRSTPYRKVTFDAQFLEAATRANDNPEFSLPGPNEFMPTKFDSAGQEIPRNARPQHLRETSLLDLWRLQADVLKTSVILDIRSPAAGGTLRKVVLDMFLAKVVQDALVGTAYAAFLAGHQFTILPTSHGATLSFCGYIDKLPLVIERVLEQVRNLSVDAKKLEETTRLMRVITLSRLIRPPRALSDEFLSYLMAESDWTMEEIAKEVDVQITPRELLDFRDSLRLHSRILMFVSGNVLDDDIIKMADVVEAGFVGTHQTFNELGPKSLLLPPGCNFVRVEKIPNPEEQQSALTYYLQVGPITDRQRDATALVLSRLLFMSLADALAQLGRDVRCELLTMPGKVQQGLIISLQSEQAPDFLEVQVDAILDDIKSFLELLGDGDIKDLKRVYRGSWDLHPKNPTDLASWYDLHLLNGALSFDHGKYSEEDLKKVTMEDIRSLFMSHVHPSSTVRSKLSIHMCSQNPTRIKRVSDDAVASFNSLLEQHVSQLDFDVPQACQDAKKILGSNPTFSEFSRYWASVLDGGKADHEVILNLIPILIERHPAGEDGAQKIEGATYIENVDGFKSSYCSGS